MQSNEARQKITAALPAKPADYEEFTRKLAQQQQSVPTISLGGVDEQRSISGLKRCSDAPHRYVTKKRPAGAVPRVQAQGSFYATQNARSSTFSFGHIRGDSSAERTPGVPATASAGARQGAKPDPPQCAAPGSVASAGLKPPRGPEAQGGSCQDSGNRRPLLWAPGAAPRAEFKLQQQAFEFLDRQGEPWVQHLGVFATELSSDGKRRFLVTTPTRLWEEDVEAAAPGSCHLYEIIREGAPCHLYFDLEFVPQFNPGVCGDLLVELLVDLVAEELRAAFGIDLPEVRQAPGRRTPDRRQTPGPQQKPEPMREPEPQQQLELEQRQPGRLRDSTGIRLHKQGAEGHGADRAGGDAGADRSAGASGSGEVATAGGARGAGPDAAHGAAPPGGLGPGPDGGTAEDGQGAPGDASGDCLGGASCPWVWELCSTTTVKFSRHLIFRIPHCAFKDNFHVNAFVRRLFDRIAADPARFAAFFVRRSADPSDPPTLFIDPAVYTRNRAFRLYLSSKAGKSAVLHATRRYAVAALVRRRGRTGPLRLTSPPAPPAAASATDSARCPLNQQPSPAAPGPASHIYSPTEAPAVLPPIPNRAADPESRDCVSRGGQDFRPHPAAAGGTTPSIPGAPQAPDGDAAGGGGLDGNDGVLLPPRVEAGVAREVFLATLITGVGRVDRMLTLYDDGGGGRGGGGGGVTSLAGFHSAADSSGAGAERAHLCLGIPRLPIPAGGRKDAGGGRAGLGLVPGRGAGPAMLHDAAAAAHFQYGPSPFPRVDEFMESVCCEGGVQGRVRCWQYVPDSGTLLLAIRNNRWCANVGRPHRSNGIFYQVDLRSGTWCQRCYDPDCRDFRSARMPLPAHLWEECNARAQAQAVGQRLEQYPPMMGQQPTG